MVGVVVGGGGGCGGGSRRGGGGGGGLTRSFRLAVATAGCTQLFGLRFRAWLRKLLAIW